MANEPEYIETGMEPEFVANHTTYEQNSGGSVRGFVWKQIHGKYVLQYTFVATSHELIEMGQHAIRAATESHHQPFKTGTDGGATH